MWDFPASAALGRLIEATAAAGRPVAAICHGVIGLSAARAGDQRPFVAGRRLTCFSNAEERALGFDRIVPMLAETELVRQGAHFSCSAPFESHVVEDGLLFTGQNPASAAALAATILQRQN